MPSPWEHRPRKSDRALWAVWILSLLMLIALGFLGC